MSREVQQAVFGVAGVGEWRGEGSLGEGRACDREQAGPLSGPPEEDSWAGTHQTKLVWYTVGRTRSRIWIGSQDCWEAIEGFK